MSKMKVLGIALILLLVSLPLISIGTMQDNATLWWLGLVLLGAAGLVPPITRYALAGEDEDEDEQDSGGNGDGRTEAKEAEG